MFIDERVRGKKRRMSEYVMTIDKLLISNRRIWLEFFCFSRGKKIVRVSIVYVISVFSSFHLFTYSLYFSPSAHGSFIMHRRVRLGIDRLVKTTHWKLLLLIYCIVVFLRFCLDHLRLSRIILCDLLSLQLLLYLRIYFFF